MPFLALIAVLVVLWLVVTIVGAVLKGLFWLLMVGLVLLLLTAGWRWSRSGTRR